MTSSNIIAVHKNGVYYFNIYPHHAILVNGKEPEICKGDRAQSYNGKWVKFNKPIRRVEVVKPQGREVISYQLQHQYRGVVQLPAEMPLGAFENTYDGLVGERAEFYEAVYRDKEPVAELVDYEVVDMDAEPRGIPDYVTVEFPANIEYRSFLWHKYPCFISPKNLFPLAKEAIMEAGKGKTDLRINTYSNLQTLTVYELLRIDGHKHPLEMKIINLVGDYREEAAERCPTLKADDYDKLSLKIDTYLEDITKRMDIPHYKVVRI